MILLAARGLDRTAEALVVELKHPQQQVFME